METCGTPFTPFCGGSSLLLHTPAGYGGDLDSLRVGFGCDTKKSDVCDGVSASVM
jgi:hypothetical protein